VKIRSITCFFDPAHENSDNALTQMGAFASKAIQECQQAGFEVQSTRLATPPLTHWLGAVSERTAVQMARNLEKQTASLGFQYLSLGPALPDAPASYDLIVPVLAATQNVFMSGTITNRADGIDMPSVRACGRVIARAAHISSDGFANLRFAALANVAPMAPFLPAAYHRGGEPAFALALESADLAVTAFSQAGSLDEACKDWLKILELQGKKLATLCNRLAKVYGVSFAGLDFSTATYPQDWCSLGAAMEKLGVPQIGTSGSLAAAAILTATLDRGDWPRTGFNGLMMPVLEDSVLAQRASEGVLSVKDLLLYSAVCGTGLDTIPLPGEVSAEQLSAVLLDVAALALRLDKQLTARLMPIPGKRAGDETGLFFNFFADSRVMALPAFALGGFLKDTETIRIPRREPLKAKHAARQS
jgi:uncharacterized protein